MLRLLLKPDERAVGSEFCDAEAFRVWHTLQDGAGLRVPRFEGGRET